ncbi:MAG: hypothetical protein U0736_16115 [Gemmataceae bacterium]
MTPFSAFTTFCIFIASDDGEVSAAATFLAALTATSTNRPGTRQRRSRDRSGGGLSGIIVSSSARGRS